MSAERLQKILASAGIASRRDCEELIVAGKIAVNGKVVRVLGSRVDPDIDTITVDGKPLEPVVQRTYVMLHKPTNVISTSEDTHDRPTVVAMIDVPARIFPVGRLDQDSEGLLLLTDDGELTQRLTHPSYEVEKEYHVLLDQTPTSDALREWREGVNIDGKRTAPAWVQTHKQTNEGTWIRMVLQEGRKRQIRMMVRSQDYAVLRLIRIREGPLSLGDLGNGEWRHLTDDEVKALWQHAGQRRFDPIRADEADHKTSYRTSKDFTTQSSRNTTSETSRERTHRQTDERRSKPPTTPPYSRQDDTPKRECNSSERRDRVAPRSSSSKRSSSDRRDRSTRDDQHGDTRKR
ncbi:MAG: pseudouridine synthase, partial [Chloroflexi bacterium AL-N1]|nr:pseudouridine synthase [Chloroflexi bacterium AL-N1]